MCNHIQYKKYLFLPEPRPKMYENKRQNSPLESMNTVIISSRHEEVACQIKRYRQFNEDGRVAIESVKGRAPPRRQPHFPRLLRPRTDFQRWLSCQHLFVIFSNKNTRHQTRFQFNNDWRHDNVLLITRDVLLGN